MMSMSSSYSVADIASAEAFLERLRLDHQRFLDLLDTLETSAEHLRPGGTEELDPAALRRAVAELGHYVSGDHHIAEDVLFGALVDGGKEIEMEAAVAELRQDHEQLEARAAYVIGGLEQVLSDEPSPRGLPARIVDLCQYERRHMSLEGQQVFPAIGRKLSGERWEAVRRQLGSRLKSLASPGRTPVGARPGI